METLWITQEQLDQAAESIGKFAISTDVVWVPLQPLKDNHIYIGIGPTLPRYKFYQICLRRIICPETSIVLNNGGKIFLTERSGWELSTPVQVVPEWLARMMQERLRLRSDDLNHKQSINFLSNQHGTFKCEYPFSFHSLIANLD